MSNDRLRAYHSFWSVPLYKNRLGRNFKSAQGVENTLVLAALSCVTAKRLGCEMVMHTDDKGAKLFDCVPYDEVYLSINDHAINEKFWASGKFVALEREPLGSCHLDIDAFIQSKYCIANILSQTEDILVQCEEYVWRYYWQLSVWMLKYISTSGTFMDGVKPFGENKNDAAYNCGIVRFTNEKLKSEYCDYYWRWVRELEAKGTRDPFFKNPHCVPDIVLEQWMLHKLIKSGGYSVKTICHPTGRDLMKNGYCHLFAAMKYKVNSLAKKLLLKYCPDTYRRVLKKIEEVAS